MKKIIFLMTIVLCFAVSNSFAQKKTNTFKKIEHTYEKQTMWFFKHVFLQEKTGKDLDTTIRDIMEKRIYDQMIRDYWHWAKFTRKHETEKKFELKLKHTKSYETEAAEYITQFKLLQKDFVDERLVCSMDQLSKILTPEKLQPYIDGVMKKFENRTKTMFLKLKP